MLPIHTGETAVGVRRQVRWIEVDKGPSPALIVWPHVRSSAHLQDFELPDVANDVLGLSQVVAFAPPPIGEQKCESDVAVGVGSGGIAADLCENALGPVLFPPEQPAEQMIRPVLQVFPGPLPGLFEGWPVSLPNRAQERVTLAFRCGPAPVQRSPCQPVPVRALVVFPGCGQHVHSRACPRQNHMPCAEESCRPESHSQERYQSGDHGSAVHLPPNLNREDFTGPNVVQLESKKPTPASVA